MENRPLAGKFETGLQAPAVPHLAFIDGLRACAAIFVVFHHTANAIWGNTFPWMFLFLSWGHATVTVFIVISGFCLALPVVRSGRELRGGSLRFYKKRAKRILPPYYAVFALTVVIWWAFHLAGPGVSLFKDPLMRKSILFHVLLIHNLFDSTQFLMNSPLWSVATELQIYVLFPLLILFWKKFGTGWLLGTTFVVAHVLYYVTGHIGNANYIFIFVLGVLSADLSVRRFKPLYPKLVLIACAFAFMTISTQKQAISDLVVGLGAAAFMALCTTVGFRLRVPLSLPMLSWIGGFSYSIYLTHVLTVTVCMELPITKKMISAGLGSQLFVLCLVPLLALPIAYVFYRFFERPFMTVHKARTARMIPQPTEISA